jgi:hypothetical protein
MVCLMDPLRRFSPLDRILVYFLTGLPFHLTRKSKVELLSHVETKALQRSLPVTSLGSALLLSDLVHPQGPHIANLPPASSPVSFKRLLPWSACILTARFIQRKPKTKMLESTRNPRLRTYAPETPMIFQLPRQRSWYPAGVLLMDLLIWSICILPSAKMCPESPLRI